MPPRLKMDKFDMEIIRPMCLVEEKDLTRIAVWRGYRKQIKNCPYESGSSRSDMKEVLSRLEAINPEARYSLWSSMSNIQENAEDILAEAKQINEARGYESFGEDEDFNETAETTEAAPEAEKAEQ